MQTAAARDIDGTVRTFVRAVSLLEPDDTLSLTREGRPYRESLALNRSGTEEKGLLFASMASGQEVVDLDFSTFTATFIIRKLQRQGLSVSNYTYAQIEAGGAS